MSRTIKGKKSAGQDWWSKRPYSLYHSTSSDRSDKFWKKQVNKVERQKAKKEVER